MLVLDQLGEPTDLAIRRLEPVLLQLEGVAIQPLAGAGQRRAHALAPFLHPAAPSLEDAQPDVGAGLGEERQPRAEALVVEGVRPDLGQQVGQVFLALGGELVDPLAPARPAARPRRFGGLLGDLARLGEVA